MAGRRKRASSAAWKAGQRKGQAKWKQGQRQGQIKWQNAYKTQRRDNYGQFTSGPAGGRRVAPAASPNRSRVSSARYQGYVKHREEQAKKAKRRKIAKRVAVGAAAVGVVALAAHQVSQPKENRISTKAAAKGRAVGSRAVEAYKADMFKPPVDVPLIKNTLSGKTPAPTSPIVNPSPTPTTTTSTANDVITIPTTAAEEGYRLYPNGFREYHVGKTAEGTHISELRRGPRPAQPSVQASRPAQPSQPAQGGVTNPTSTPWTEEKVTAFQKARNAAGVAQEVSGTVATVSTAVGAAAGVAGRVLKDDEEKERAKGHHEAKSPSAPSWANVPKSGAQTDEAPPGVKTSKPPDVFKGMEAARKKQEEMYGPPSAPLSASSPVVNPAPLPTEHKKPPSSLHPITAPEQRRIESHTLTSTNSNPDKPGSKRGKDARTNAQGNKIRTLQDEKPREEEKLKDPYATERDRLAAGIMRDATRFPTASGGVQNSTPGAIPLHIGYDETLISGVSFGVVNPGSTYKPGEVHPDTIKRLARLEPDASVLPDSLRSKQTPRSLRQGIDYEREVFADRVIEDDFRMLERRSQGDDVRRAAFKEHAANLPTYEPKRLSSDDTWMNKWDSGEIENTRENRQKAKRIMDRLPVPKTDPLAGIERGRKLEEKFALEERLAHGGVEATIEGIKREAAKPGNTSFSKSDARRRNEAAEKQAHTSRQKRAAREELERLEETGLRVWSMTDEEAARAGEDRYTRIFAREEVLPDPAQAIKHVAAEPGAKVKSLPGTKSRRKALNPQGEAFRKPRKKPKR